MQVVDEDSRPLFPAHIPKPYVELAERCWRRHPEQRPTFDAVLADLEGLLERAPELQAACQEQLQEFCQWLAVM